MPESRLKDEQLLLDAVRDAGELAGRLFEQSVNSWNKADGTPVSDADMAVNDLLRARLKTARPDYGWLSEETEDVPERMQCERIWVIDPIDGTRSFLKGTNNWCVAAALVENRRPVLGAVFAPINAEMYHARASAGAFLNGVAIRTSARKRLAGAKMIAHEKTLSPERWLSPWPHLVTGMTTSIALRLCLVANGSFDATLAIGDKCDWDLAAGDLIVSEAGGQVTNLDGGQMVYNLERTRQSGLIASGAQLHDEIIVHSRSFRGF